MPRLNWPDYTPGSKYGPCEEPCQHQDCAAIRQLGFSQCRVCGQQLEAGEAFYFCQGDACGACELGENTHPFHAHHIEGEGDDEEG